MTQDMAAIKWWQRNQVEDAKQYVDKDAFIENRCEWRNDRACVERTGGNNPVNNAVPCGGRCRNDSKHQKTAHGNNKVADRSDQGSKNVIAHEMPEVSSINRRRFSPSEQRSSGDCRDQRQQNRAKQVDMSDGIQANPTEHACRRITQSICHPSMRRLMHADGKKKDDDVEND